MDNNVTMVIPVYNSEKYISRCIESVLNQTYKNVDILIINDGSKDNSQKIIDGYAKKYKNIITIEQKNMGVANTRNKAIQMTNTEYIMFMDNDDYIDKDYIETLLKNAEDGKYDIVVCGYRRPNENGKILKEVKLENYEFAKYNVLSPWSKIYRTDFLKKNNLEFLNNDIGEDLYLNYQAYACTNKIKTIDYVGYNWFLNTKSVSSTKQRNAKKVNTFKFFNECYDTMKKKDLINKNYDVIEYTFFTTVVWYLSYCTKELNFKEICEEYDKSFGWLNKHFPDYKKNKFIGFNKAKGQEKIVRNSLAIMLFLHKIHLGKVATYLYSKL